MSDIFETESDDALYDVVRQPEEEPEEDMEFNDRTTPIDKLFERWPG